MTRRSLQGSLSSLLFSSLLPPPLKSCFASYRICGQATTPKTSLSRMNARHGANRSVHTKPLQGLKGGEILLTRVLQGRDSFGGGGADRGPSLALGAEFPSTVTETRRPAAQPCYGAFLDVGAPRSLPALRQNSPLQTETAAPETPAAAAAAALGHSNAHTPATARTVLRRHMAEPWQHEGTEGCRARPRLLATPRPLDASRSAEAPGWDPLARSLPRSAKPGVTAGDARPPARAVVWGRAHSCVAEGEEFQLVTSMLGKERALRIRAPPGALVFCGGGRFYFRVLFFGSGQSVQVSPILEIGSEHAIPKSVAHARQEDGQVSPSPAPSQAAVAGAGNVKLSSPYLPFIHQGEKKLQIELELAGWLLDFTCVNIKCCPHAVPRKTDLDLT